MAKKTIRLSEDSEKDLDAIRANLAARMPLSTEISDVDVIRHALRMTAEQARIDNGNPPRAKRAAKARGAAK